eukprot:scaffold42769_cov63-Attheya_sp.AAC.2
MEDEINAAGYEDECECDLTVTVTATLPPGLVANFNENDPLWPSHAIENQSAFLLHAEKAHIFPHNECAKVKQKDGKKIKVETNYEWLDDPADVDFKFLYLSPSMHLCFDGSGRGRRTTTATQSAICIKPLARTIDHKTVPYEQIPNPRIDGNSLQRLAAAMVTAALASSSKSPTTAIVTQMGRN